ncbi:AfsR/SARP family transcriptional regulator [Sedimentitalea todarodis]|uniref:BTAD domain-containing putative transcriptional regulator n=1 Tax=Sedimentitalea todarodis TaxID=1631240 RepID=A0ABU3VBW8_9RHOB|nr:BTAD domain-containing putative transcriptional regulator [Sedimentitalea todarodis]MDU9003675.1 BTAD domain-containing putative transcriptional regulator [Sedimentitalea todarodis]
MPEPNLRLHLFGRFRVTLAGEEIPVRSASARAILAYLAVCKNHSEDRGRLAATIWESSVDARARQNLRQALHALSRPDTPLAPVLRADRTRVALEPDFVETDVRLLLQEIDAGHVRDELIHGALRPDYLLAAEPVRGELFDSWLRLLRQDMENRLRERLAKLMEQPDPTSARRAADALLALDPADEQAVRFLIQYHHTNGQTAQALRTYEALWTYLEEEFDAEPGHETIALIARIKAQEPTPAMDMQTNPAQHLRIGLTPVTAGGSSYATGVACLFRAELMATLLRFRAFEIVDLSIASAPVDYALDVSIGGDERELLLLAVLKRSSDGAALWSDRWTELTDHWLQTQAAIVSRLASSLSIYVSLTRIQELRRTEFGASAFDDWLIGNQHLDEFRAEGRAAAARCFKRVIEKAPEASMGYSSLARLMNAMHLMQPCMFRQKETHRESKRLASKAVALDPLDARAHLHRAWACCLLGEYDQASAGFAMARQCNPNDPWTMLSSGLGAAFSDELPLATELSQRVIREGWTTAPFQWGFHMPIRFLAGDYEGCVTAAENAGTAILNVPAWKAAALWHLGRRAEAQTSWAEFEMLSRSHSTDSTKPSSQTICEWYLSCFPVRNSTQRRKMAEGAAGAAGLQLHCVQQ